MMKHFPANFLPRLDIVAPLASAMGMTGGALVLCGWALDMEWLKRVLPGMVSMNPMTAVSFMLAGASLWLQRDSHASPSALRAARICAFALVGIGLLRLLKDAGIADAGIDTVLFAGKLAHDTPSYSNQMAPNTALSLVLLGSALCLLNTTTRRGWRPAEALAILAGLTSLLALFGYAYGVRSFYGVASFIPMALHTAVLIHLLAWGVLCARRESGMMAILTSASAGGMTARRLFPGVVLILFVLGLLRLEGERRGLYAAELGVTLYTVANIAIFGALIWWSVRSLHHMDLERQRTEAQRDRFFTLSLDMLGIAGMDGYFKRLSPAFQQTLGYTTEELMARPFIDFVHPDDRSRTLEEVAKLNSNEPTLQFENRYRCKDGSWRWLSWKTQPFLSEGLLYATARDVTERKEAEDSIKQLNAELNHRAAQLEETNKELESFSYTVSHDLRAPLRHVQGYVQMLNKAVNGQLPEKPRRYLQTISDASAEMGRLIDDLLAFSRLGRTGLREEVVHLGELAQQTIRGLEMTTQGRRISWSVGMLPDVIGDAAMLRQVLANLIDNAVKYTRRCDHAEIQIGCDGEEDGRLIFFVKDNGAGFDMQYVHKLFGVFQRLHRADEFEGTGIGLATVRRVIARHGGRTWAEGKLGVGAAFYFTLFPAHRTQPHHPDTAHAHS